MRRSINAALVTAVGIVILADLVISNPALGGLAGFLTGLLVLLAAAAAVAGTLSLLRRHVGRLATGTDRIGSVALLVGMALILLPGLVPGSSGADAPAVRWVVAALLAPLVAAIFALLFPLLLAAIRRGLHLRGPETLVMLAGAVAVLVLLLPLGGTPGLWLADAADWVQTVPVAAVFRGLLLGVAAIGAVTAARILLGADGVDD